jgi:uncharacterized protein (TIGR02722 family)
MRKFIIFIFVALALSCSSTPKVSRVSSDKQVDLSGNWNDTDVKIVCNSLIKDCLSSARVRQAIDAKNGKTPVVLVGNFSNDSSEHIDTSIIAVTMEKAIFDSGKLDFVAGGKVRDQLRNERQSQQTNASEDTAKKLANEIGADYLLTGSVKVVVDSNGAGKQVRAYFVNAEMTNIETGARMWMGQNNEIKKEISRAKNKF